MKLTTESVYCLNEAINKLHEAARAAEDNETASLITELADCANAIKDWDNEHQ